MTIVIAVGLGLGCLGPVPGEGDKTLEFYSESAYEFVVEGRTALELEDGLRDASDEAQTQRLHELIGLKHVAIAYFLTQYFIEKDDNEPGAGWGGMGGLARAGSYRELDIRRVDSLRYEFTFQQIVAGPVDLLRHLPLETGEDGQPRFVVTIGNPSNAELAELESDHEWFRSQPWAGWNPARAEPAQRVDQMLSISPAERGADAWLDYPRLFEDDKLTIDVHMGYDYHNQYHVAHSRTVFQWLVGELGFEPPVATFEQLDNTSGPFRRDLDANGRTIGVELQLFYGKDGSSNDPSTDEGGRVMDEDFRRSMATADVILFSGHSGPFYGFALANWKRTSEGDISYREIESIEMPADRYQVVMADGCDTYQTAQAFERNPNKLGGRNINVVTTTSWGDAETPDTVKSMITHLVGTDPQTDVHRPRTLRSLLTQLENAGDAAPLYGIHFIGDNPRLHPYADTSYLCEPCSYHRQCGAAGNRCANLGDEPGVCVAACTASEVCPAGYTCERIARPSAHAIYDYGCIREGLLERRDDVADLCDW